MSAKLANLVLRLSKPQGTNRQYVLILLALWIYSVLWIAAAASTCLSNWKLWRKVAVGVVLAIITPDLERLFMSRKKYLDLLDTQRK